jgi:peptidoglycan/LPS O-acetylase OafA/YrhL
MGVELFFLISGYVISLSANNATANSFFVGRFIRLVPCVWICATITLLFVLFTNSDNTYSLWIRYMKSMIFFPKGDQIDASYWTLGIEVSFYFYIWLLLVSNKFDKFWIFITILLIVSSIYNVALTLVDNPQSYIKRSFDLILLRHGCEFAMGSLIYKISKNNFSFKNYYIYLLLVLGFIGSSFEVVYSSLNLIKYGHEYKTTTLIVIWGMIFFTFIMVIAYNDKISALVSPTNAKHIRQLGMMTYPLYLIHQVVGGVILNKLTVAGFENYSSLLICIIFILILTFLITKVEAMIKQPIKNLVLLIISKLSTKRLGLN